MNLMSCVKYDATVQKKKFAPSKYDESLSMMTRIRFSSSFVCQCEKKMFSTNRDTLLV